MLRRILARALAAAVALATPIAAQTAAPAPGASGRHMLWTVSKGETTVYLLGSIHVLTPDVYPLPAVIDSAFLDAERVVFETSLDTAMLRAGEMLTRGTFADGRTLEDALAPETYALLEQTLPKFGVPLAQVQRFEPWFVGMLLTQITAQRSGLRPEYGIDMHVKGRAQQAGKPLGSLESVDFQMGLFDSLSPADQDAFLRSSLAGIDTAARTFEAMKQAWRTGDAEGLARSSDVSMQKYPAVRAALLVDRNRRWVPQIEAMLNGPDDVLVVVGAGHLVGRESVVELLRERGWTVTQH
jgi:uncharacterized protein YbaP (TraB family)